MAAGITLVHLPMREDLMILNPNPEAAGFRQI
jgi:hypothetical protein